MVDVVSDQTEISYAEAVTGWTGDTFVIDNEVFIQGANAVNCNQTNNGVNDVTYSGTYNMAGKHIRLFFQSNISANMATSNAVQVLLADGTNTATWTVYNTAADYGGGWKDVFLDVDSTPDVGSVNSAAVTTITLRINTATKPRNSINGWYDNWRFGNGLTINSTAAEAISFTDAAVEDGLVANKYGILELIDGVLFGKGEIILGDTGAKNCNLVSSNEQIVFIDRIVATNLYKIKTQQATGATDVDISGLVCKTVGASGAELDFSSTLTSLSITSSTFISMGLITLTPTVTTPTFSSNSFTSCGATTLAIDATSCSWSTCDQITVTTGKLDGCTINQSTALAAVSCSSLTTGVPNCVFISDGTGYAVDLGTGVTTQTMDWTGEAIGYAATDGATGNEVIKVAVADNNTLTINNNGVGTLTIHNASAGNGAVNVVSGQATLTLTGLQPNTEVRVYNTGTQTVFDTGVENSGTTYGITYSTPAAFNVDIVIHHIDYEHLRLTNVTLGSSSASLPIQQRIDRWYNNP